MTPRGTDWSLALLVALLVATGTLTLFAGGHRGAWVFAAHGTGGFALGLVLVWKLRRVRPRLLDPRRWDRRTRVGVVSVALVAAALGSGIVWSSGAVVAPAGYSLLAWHDALGALLALLVAVHMLVRARRPRLPDLASRRQFLQAGAVALGAVAAWQLQRPAQALVGLRGARRRFTGSYEAASFEGNAFPTTSWVADRPRPLAASRCRLEVEGEVTKSLWLPFGEVDRRDELVATLDCTGGFYSEQCWRGVLLGRVLDRAGLGPAAKHVQVVSRTGYRWSFDLAEARAFLLATRVGAELLSHEHGSPLRLVAPGRRGFQWVKWVERIEVSEGTDHGAPASTIWSSFTPKGRGAA